uniref:Iron-sulfur cluster assembly 1 homolog, mitochondrial n=1 Tax=Equus asinus TaxID=9793 RepID=A0A9L0IFW6_EQUAS
RAAGPGRAPLPLLGDKQVRAGLLRGPAPGTTLPSRPRAARRGRGEPGASVCAQPDTHTHTHTTPPTNPPPPPGPPEILAGRGPRGQVVRGQTPSAVNKIKQLLKDKPEHVGVKVGVRTRGCNGLSYTLEYTKTKGDSDEEVVQDGVRVFIEKKAQLTLLGTEMDYVEDKLSSEFVFNNPNIKGTCGCGESFNI